VSNRKPSLPQVRYSNTPLGGGQTPTGVSFPGGLDQVTPSLRLQPGAVRGGVNFEVAQSGGYSRIVGYERTDGHAAPSAASYQLVQVSSFTNVPAVGQTVTQAVSGATGTIFMVVTGATPYLALTQVTGGFDTTDVLTTPGPVTVGTAVPVTASLSAETDAQYTSAAADVYRALIGAVPGSGPVFPVAMIFLGVDNLYAFRANAGNTATLLYKATSSGWALVPFFNLVNFTAGSVMPIDGDTLTQGGVTATIQRVMWQSGAFASSPGDTAVGALVVTNPAGGNFGSGAATTTSGGAFSLSGVQTPITLLPGGTYEFVKCNFSGQLVSRRIFGVDGVNPPFGFDGVTYSPIATGLSPNAPNHIAFQSEYLFISQASSIFYCGAGSPYMWDAVDGGGEIATGDAVTSMITLPGSQTSATLGIYMRTNTAFLYNANDAAMFNYVTFNTGLGALPRSAQNLFDTFVFDTLGVVTLRTTLNWGNFLPTTLTKNLLPFITQERSKLACSCVFREKSSYRLFFSDGYGLWITLINQQYLGSLPVLFPNPVASCDQQVNTFNEEVIYFGSSDGLGYVYQLERGTSFDGAEISAYITMAWDPIKTPRILKRFRAGSIEMQGDAYASIQFGYQLGYDSALVGQPVPTTYATNFAATPHWDQFTWDQFTWDGSTLAPTDVDMTGTAENVQVTVTSGTNYIAAYTLNSLIYHYSMGRGIRV
jgi:hypothetical protein